MTRQFMITSSQFAGIPNFFTPAIQPRRDFGGFVASEMQAQPVLAVGQ